MVVVYGSIVVRYGCFSTGTVQVDVMRSKDFLGNSKRVFQIQYGAEAKIRHSEDLYG